MSKLDLPWKVSGETDILIQSHIGHTLIEYDYNNLAFVQLTDEQLRYIVEAVNNYKPKKRKARKKKK